MKTSAPKGCIRAVWYVDFEISDISNGIPSGDVDLSDPAVRKAICVAAARQAKQMIEDPDSLGSFWELEHADFDKKVLIDLSEEN